ncbi:tRNA-dihydrouridine synthase A [Candidatus Kinetoplastibacterium desouzaii TCC079E]|uniref:tRNA-dihydrouridine synthase n=1 Tax=Candidatus Kinetoplastidibacterium desouzai TCC079E TaxID=1208919 RepID=M1LM30_9PROT|nr:tRNA dihydrouridine(20/20a) synthase DusA [Candidatus Kinetoplastibacterium desouzaii]AGF46772.1 tRNA-dihydrouridine synthase A [Candidatus Kinetoplastibacterium desouzaii TCC079E]
MSTNHYQKNLWKFCVAPMLGVTDRHCLFFYSLLSSNVRLYTEMIVTSTIINNLDNVHKYLYFDKKINNHIALQLGGNNPVDLAKSAVLGEKFGYNEINLNCGCPSDRVLSGAFGASLMLDPMLVASCVKSIKESVSIPISIKHRLGLNNNSSYSFVRDFVGMVHEAGCEIFIVHARNAMLGKMSPKKNRSIPPLNYEYVYQLKKDFPNAIFILNGGLSDIPSIEIVLKELDGVMLGRKVMNNPLFISDLSGFLWPNSYMCNVDHCIKAMVDYAKKEVYDNNTPLWFVLKPMLNMFNGHYCAKKWRKNIADQVVINKGDPDMIWVVWEEFKKTIKK